MRVIAILCMMILCISCNKQRNNEGSATEQDVIKCYQYINNKDTVLLKTISIGRSVSGTLVYNLYEKDKNTGTIQGHINGALLIADYTFISEGVSSVRQVVFRKEGRTLIQGNGDVIVDPHGKTVFNNIDSLDFTGSILLTEVDCEEGSRK
jgi:hypothetical protein